MEIDKRILEKFGVLITIKIFNSQYRLNINKTENLEEAEGREYSIYSNVVYNSGRKKVLNHFLTMNRIFKTDFFIVSLR